MIPPSHNFDRIGQTCHQRWLTGGTGGSVAELTRRVGAPCKDLPVGKQCQRVSKSTRYRHGVGDSTDLHWHGAIAVSVAELSAIVGSPSPNGAVAFDRQ